MASPGATAYFIKPFMPQKKMMMHRMQRDDAPEDFERRVVGQMRRHPVGL